MSSGPFSLLELLGPFMYLIPLLVIWLAGIVVALARWQRHSTVSLLAVLALLVLSVSAVGGTIATQWIIRARGEMAWTSQEMATYFAVLNVGRTLLSCVGYALLLVAVFGWRWQAIRIPMDDGPRPHRAPPPDDAIRAPGPQP